MQGLNIALVAIGGLTVLLSLVAGLVAMWLVSGGLAYALLDVPLWITLLVGAIVTPTDPVLAGTIVTGDAAERNIPESIRDLLTAESGANDGLAYALVFLPILVLEHPPGRALTDWLLETLLWEVGAAVVIGVAVGAAIGTFRNPTTATRNRADHES